MTLGPIVGLLRCAPPLGASSPKVRERTRGDKPPRRELWGGVANLSLASPLI